MTDDTRFRLDPDRAVRYLTDRDAVPTGADAVAEPLGGGVSNRVVRIAWSGGCLVAKQPLPNLAVEDDWPADVERVHNEVAALRAWERILQDAGTEAARVPSVAFESDADHVIAVACAPSAAEMWKRELLDGHVDRDVAAAVGDALGTVHTAAADDDRLRERFADETPFIQLRIDPYHRTVVDRHPDVADQIRDEVERVLGTRRTLVHGDYSPKNVLVDRSGAAPAAWLLDFEVAHWGDPAFDAAFMLNHLLIKSVYNRADADAYVDAALAFWRAYRLRVGWDVDFATARELAVLMLARVDGKSPVEYIDDRTAGALRRAAKHSLASGVDTVREVVAVVGEEREAL